MDEDDGRLARRVGRVDLFPIVPDDRCHSITLGLRGGDASGTMEPMTDPYSDVPELTIDRPADGVAAHHARRARAERGRARTCTASWPTSG